MIKLYKCVNTDKLKGTGLDITVNGMTLDISEGTMLYKGNTIVIDNHEVTFDVLDVPRQVFIYLVNDANEPIICREEIDKDMNGVSQELIMKMSMFTIPAYCSSLDDIEIQVWHYEDRQGEVVQIEENINPY